MARPSKKQAAPAPTRAAKPTFRVPAGSRRSASADDPTEAGGTDNQAFTTTGFGARSRLWAPPSYGPNSALDGSADMLRRQGRELNRKNGWAFAATQRIVSHTVGTGIVPVIKNKKVAKLWRRWTAVADADGALDFYGMQALALSGVVPAGETFGRMRTRRLSDGLPVPLQIQLMEAEFCPIEKNMPLPNGGYIRQGIEFSPIGKRENFWMYQRHPNDLFALSTDLQPTPIPTEEVLHMFRPLRAGQIRGESWFAPIMAMVKDADEYVKNEMARKKTASMFGGFIKRPAPSSIDIEELIDAWKQADIDAKTGDGEVTLEPGGLHALGVGEEIEFSAPSDVGNNYEVFMKWQYRGIAAALGVLYEMLTGDFADMNDRTWRAAFNDFMRRVEQWQYHMVIFQFCQPVFVRWVMLGQMAGVIPDSFDPWDVTWRPQKQPYINPVQDVQAQRDEVRAGFTSRRRIVADGGEDAEEIDAENAEDNARADAAGVIYESDGRQKIGGAPAPAADGEATGGGGKPKKK